MTATSSDPDVSHGADARPGGVASIGASRWQKVIGIVGLVVAVWVGDSLYDVISQGAGGRPEHGPAGETPPSQPMDGESPPPSGGGGHDPSQFDHG